MSFAGRIAAKSLSYQWPAQLRLCTSPVLKPLKALKFLISPKSRDLVKFDTRLPSGSTPRVDIQIFLPTGRSFIPRWTFALRSATTTMIQNASNGDRNRTWTIHSSCNFGPRSRKVVNFFLATNLKWVSGGRNQSFGGLPHLTQKI